MISTPRLLAIAVSLLLPAAALAAPGDVVFNADLDGNLALPACARSGPLPTTGYAALVSALRQARAQDPDALVLLGGNVVGPGLFARDLMESAGGPQALAVLVGEGGYRAMALGHHDLAADQRALVELAAELRRRHVPLVASNLRCDGARAPLCAAVVPAAVVGRSAIVALLSPSLLPGLSPASRAGLTLTPLHEAAARAIPRLRAAGAERVVLMVDVPRTWKGVEELAALQHRFAAGGPAPDVILASGLAGRGSTGTLRLLEQDGAPPVIGSSPSAASAARVRLRPAGPGAEVTLLPASPADQRTVALLEPLEAAYCRRHGAPIGGGPVKGEISRDQWVGYLLAVMRRHARAEVALLNRDFVKADPFPLHGPLTRADLLRAMPYHGTVGTAVLPGARLAALLAPALARPELAALGIEGGKDGRPLTINGRALDATRSYRVATIAFVAAGGDDLFPGGALPFTPAPGAPDLRRLVEQFLQTGTAAEDGDPAIDPGTDFGRPAAERSLLVGLGDLTVDLTETRIARQPGQVAPQLTRAQQRSIKGELTAVGQLRARLHEADARLKVVYGHARNQPADQPAVSAETADLLSLSALYDFRGLRNLEAPVPRIAVPDPYARLLLESELTRPAVTPTQTRDYHHAELTATAGAIFSLTPKLRLRGGGGARKQLVAPGAAGRTRPLLEAGGSLDPIPLFSYAGLSARLEGLFDYVFLDPFAAREHQLKATARVSLPILPLLFITAGADLFAAQQGGAGWGTALDGSIGLRLHWDGARQSL